MQQVDLALSFARLDGLPKGTTITKTESGWILNYQQDVVYEFPEAPLSVVGMYAKDFNDQTKTDLLIDP